MLSPQPLLISMVPLVSLPPELLTLVVRQVQEANIIDFLVTDDCLDITEE